MSCVAKKQDEDRVSLAPLDAETALRALLKVDSESEPQDEPDKGKQKARQRDKRKRDKRR